MVGVEYVIVSQITAHREMLKAGIAIKRRIVEAEIEKDAHPSGSHCNQDGRELLLKS